MAKSSANNAPSKAALKRGRGRPPKKKEIVAPITSSAAAPPPAKRGRGRPKVDKIDDEQYDATRKELLTRKKEIQTRLAVLTSYNVASPTSSANIEEIISSGTSPSKSADANVSPKSIISNLPSATKTHQHPTSQKSDTHWDFTLKEMAWLSADFQSERKRQISQAKKLSNAILSYFATLSAKKARERVNFEARTRRLASKMNRMVHKSYWKKMERVVEYKQRLEGENTRRKEMDKRLVFLVRQTERYGERLRDNSTTTGNSGDNEKEKLTIEEALSNSLGRRKTKSFNVDYTKLDKDLEHTDDDESISSLYGAESNVMLSPSLHNTRHAGSRNPSVVKKKKNVDEGEDYEPTEEEIIDEDENESEEYTALVSSFQEIPKDQVHVEMQKLLEEKDMDMETLLQRLMEEGQQEQEQEDQAMEVDDAEQNAGESKPLIEVVGETQPAVAETEVNSLAVLNEDDHEKKDEFHLEREEMDDETTIEAEEKLGRDMSYQDEIALLQKENEMSVEELRAMYSNMDDDNNDDDTGVASDEEEGDDAAPTLSNEGAQTAKEDALASLDEDDHEEKDEFHLKTEELDDETTIEVEEKLGRDMSYQDEIALLQKENEMSVEELRAIYANMEEDEASTHDEDEDIPDSPTKTICAPLDEDDYEEKDEFHLEKEELDDETTIEAEEKLGRDMSYQDEIALLQKENEMSTEELRAMYANMDEGGDATSCDEAQVNNNNSPRKEILSTLDEDDHEEKDEFHLEKMELDDETTIEAEEKLGRDMSYKEEIDLLQKENEMSVEELRAMYANMEGAEANEDEESASVESVESEEDKMDISSESSKRKAHDSDSDVPSKKGKVDKDEGISALESLAASDTKARETMLTRPFLLAGWVKLRAYQHVGLNWLVSIQSRRLNGILADEMGLGKTLQTISMLAYLASYKGIWGPHLIIVPTSCLVNWEVEFKRFCPGLKVMCYYGNAKRRKELRTGWTKPNVHHVVITSYQIAVQDSFAFKRKKWYYLILDEAHNIKNFESQRWQTLIGFNTQRRLLLTGTPLQNNLMELWSLLHFLMPHVFTDRKQFSYWFSNPMDSIIEGNTKRSDDLINRLHGIIRPFVLRRLKKDVETQLPGKFEHIVKCQLSRRQMFLYEEFIARSSTRKAMSGGHFMGMMSVLMQLRKVCNHPDLFEPRSVDTPFVMEPISMSTAACVVDAIEPKSALEQVSPFLRLPLWTIGRGTPTFDKSVSVDTVLAGRLSELKIPESTIVEDVKDEDLTEPLPPPGINAGLFSMLSRIRAAEKEERVSRAKFVSNINTQRCEASAFPYSGRLCRAVSIDSNICDLPLKDELTAPQLAATPLELLAMRKSQEERAEELDDIAEKFVFCVPKAGTKKPILFSSNNNSASLIVERTLMSKTGKALDNYFTPFKKAESRLTMCFPDKKLVQFDAGKLQKLAVLLRELKQGGHRVLIFTQMSKMLDVLEAFLNLNGHTYLRLDGATDVERRQRLMDRFNNDPKMFCFILSTRSGGLGINLTGADTVIFYDSDWNPAMDAQAQDRAHRIGQTREVHIYRMVTEHSIEENILTKAKQKRNLDFLVMDEGKFHSKAPDDIAAAAAAAADEEPEEDDNTLTANKLQNILGIQAEADVSKSNEAEDPMSKDQLETAMAALEDEDDAKAATAAKQEAAAELQEFDESGMQDKQDENAPGESKSKDTEKKENDTKPKRRPSNASVASIGSSDNNPKSKQADDTSDDENEMEKEFAKWQRKAGVDAATIHESLNSLERYGLHVKEYIDPFYSKYFWAEYQRLSQTKTENDEWDIEEIEQRKVKEELKAFEDGDLLATFPEPESLPRQRELYIREKARLKSEIVRRKLTGQNWATKMDERVGKLFWYNVDTGEATWEPPQVLKMLEAEEVARSKGWTALPHKLLVRVMEYLTPYPERSTCAQTCSSWNAAAKDSSFVMHVWPIEQGAMVMEKSKLSKNHFRTLSDAIEAAQSGDTIELGDGHYFINDPGLVVDKPVKLVGDENEPSHVILELSGKIVWKSPAGWIEGVTIRRPRIAIESTPNNDMLRVESGGRLDMFHCLFDNHGSVGNCISVDDNAGGQWEKVRIAGGADGHSGLFVKKDAKLELVDCNICDNDGVGFASQDGAVVKMKSCTIEKNNLASKMKEEIMLVPSSPDNMIASH